MNPRYISKAKTNESDSFYRQLFEANLDAIAIFGINPDGTAGPILEVNRAAIKLSRLPRESIIGKNIQDFDLGSDTSMDSLRIKKLLNQKSIRFETKAKSPDGREFHLDIRATLIDYHGQKAVMNIVRDMTPLLILQEAYKSLVDNSLQGISIYQDGRIAFVNDALCKMNGYTREELMALDHEETLQLIHPDDRQRLLDYYQGDHQRLDVPHYFTARGLRKDGSVWWMEIQSAIITYQGKAASQLVYIDITERLNAEKRLSDELKLRQEIFQNAKDGIVIINQNHKIYDANPRFCEMLGYSADEIKKLHTWDFETIQNAEEIRQNFKDLSSLDINFETRHRRKDGSIYQVEISATGTVWDGQNMVFCTCRDITEKRELEAELENERRLLGEIIDRIPLLITRYDPKGKMIYVNQAFEETIGWTTEEIKNLDLMAEVYPDPDYRQIAYKFMLKASNEWREFQLTAKDGRLVPSRWSNLRLNDGSQIGIGFDLTRQKEDEKALQESEERFRKAIMTSSDTITISHFEKGTYISVNEGFTKTTGYSKAETIGKTAFDLNLWVHPDLWLEIYQALKDHGSVENKEVLFRMKDDSVRYGLMSATLLQIQDEAYLMSIIKDITELKKAEIELREKTELLQSITGNMQDLVTLSDLNGICIYASPSFKQLGYKPSELVGQFMLELIHPEDRLAVEGIFQQRLNTDVKLRAQFRYRRSDGSYCWLNTTGTVIYDADGNPEKLLYSTHDISAQKEAYEEALKFKSITDRALHGAAIADLDGTLIYINQYFANIHGYQPKELIGKKLTVFHSQQQMPIVEKALHLLKTKGEFPQTEIWHIREDGTEFPTLMSGVCIRNEKGEPIYLAANAIDITELKKAEQQLLESESKASKLSILLRAILESPQDMIVFALDTEYRYIAFTKAHEKTMKKIWGKDIRIGKNMLDYISNPNDRNNAKANFDQTLEGNFFILEEEYGNSAYYRTFYEDRYSPLITDDGELIGLTVFVLDITQRKEAEERIKNSLAEKETLLREIHHRVKNNFQLITSILNLQANLIDSPETLEIFRESQNRIKAMAMIHEQIYRSEMSSSANFALYVNKLAEYLRSAYSHISGKVELIVQIPPIAFPNDLLIPLGLILNELISNAFKHAFPRNSAGTINVLLEKNQKGHYTLIVRDDGSGIPEESETGQSKTLGLFLVKTLARQIHGELSLEKSKPGTKCSISFEY